MGPTEGGAFIVIKAAWFGDHLKVEVGGYNLLPRRAGSVSSVLLQIDHFARA